MERLWLPGLSRQNFTHQAPVNKDGVTSSPGETNMFHELRKLSPCGIGEMGELPNPSQSQRTTL